MPPILEALLIPSTGPVGVARASSSLQGGANYFASSPRVGYLLKVGDNMLDGFLVVEAASNIFVIGLDQAITVGSFQVFSFLVDR